MIKLLQCSSLPTSKGDLKSNIRHPDSAKPASVNDPQDSNGKARKPIVERIAPNNAPVAAVTTATARNRNPDILKQVTAVSHSLKPAASNSHQPRENQAWMNKMKRPSSEGQHLRDGHVDDRKRQKADQQAHGTGSGNRPAVIHKSRQFQQEVAKARADPARARLSPFPGTGRTSRHGIERYSSFFHDGWDYCCTA